MKQIFKGSELTSAKCMNSILRFFYLATHNEFKEGINWYKEANEYSRELSSRFNISLPQAVGIISALSPQTSWVDNKRYAVSYLMNRHLRIRSQANTNKVRNIIALKNENAIYMALSTQNKAYKTKAFFLNILNPDIVTNVTIDRHAIAACIQTPNEVEALDNTYGQLTKQQYDFFQYCYVQTASKLHILPQQLQAIVWTVYRRVRNLKQHTTTTHWKPFETDVTF